MNRRVAVTNRVVLAVVGLVLLAGGAFVLARSWSALPGLPAAQPVLSRAQRGYAAGHDWFWYVVAAFAVLVALLAVLWLLSQGRSGAVRRLHLDSGGSGRTGMTAGALTQAVRDEVGDFPDVHRAGARLLRPVGAPRLRLRLVIDDRCDWPALRERLRAEGIAHLAAALELDRLPAAVRLRVAANRSDRRHLT